MAYNLNQNPGTSYDRELRHRRALVVFVIILVLIALLILIYIGIQNPSNVSNENKDLIERQKLIQAMTSTSSSTLSVEDKTERAATQKSLNGSKSSSAPSPTNDPQKDALMKAMEGH